MVKNVPTFDGPNMDQASDNSENHWKSKIIDAVLLCVALASLGAMAYRLYNH
jgi:hypothetical protein